MNIVHTFKKLRDWLFSLSSYTRVKESDEWSILVLYDNENLQKLGFELEKAWPRKIRLRKITGDFCELNGKNYKLMESYLGKIDKKIVTAYGDGRKHHLTYWLCKVYADKLSKEYCYIHFDKHDDFGEGLNATFVRAIMKSTNAKALRYIGDFREGLNAATFVRDIMKSTNAKALRCIGCIHIDPEKIKKEVKNFKWTENLKIPNQIEPLLENTPEDVYVSMDLDVLSDGVTTSCGNGNLEKNVLLESLSIIKERKNLIGADVLGLSQNCPASSKSFKVSVQTYADIISKIVD